MIPEATILNHVDHAKGLCLLPVYKKAAKSTGIPVQILLGKDSRETWLGSYPGLAANGWYGSDGKSKGISQINVEQHPEANLMRGDAHEWFIRMGAELLKTELNRFGGNMKAALAAYNTGPGDVQKALHAGQDPDRYTTHGNYAGDILQRAKIIKKEFTQKALLKGIPGLLILLAGGRFIVEQIKQKQKRK